MQRAAAGDVLKMKAVKGAKSPKKLAQLLQKYTFVSSHADEGDSSDDEDMDSRYVKVCGCVQVCVCVCECVRGLRVNAFFQVRNAQTNTHTHTRTQHTHTNTTHTRTQHTHEHNTNTHTHTPSLCGFRRNMYYGSARHDDDEEWYL